jgi:predicted MFS family arabinose efflux permease
VTIAWVFYARDRLGSGGVEVGWLTAVFTLAYTLTVATLSRAYSRVADPRWMVVPACALIGLVMLFPLSNPEYLPLLLSTGIFGGLLAGLWPLMLSLVSHQAEGAELSRTMGTFSIAWAPGLFMGPFIGGWLYEREFTAPFVLAAILMFAAAALVLGAARRGPAGHVPGQADPVAAAVGNATAAAAAAPPPLLPPPLAVRKERASNGESSLRYVAWLAGIAIFATAGATRALLPLWGVDVLALGESGVGSLLLVRPALMALTVPLLGRASFWHFRRWPLVVATAVAALALAGLPHFEHLAVVVVLLMVLGASTAMAASSTMFHAMSGAGRARAGRAALTEASIASGLIVGSVVTGVLYDAGGAVLAASVLAAVAAALAVAVALLLPRQGKRGGATTTTSP